MNLTFSKSFSLIYFFLISYLMTGGCTSMKHMQMNNSEKEELKNIPEHMKEALKKLTHKPLLEEEEVGLSKDSPLYITKALEAFKEFSENEYPPATKKDFERLFLPQLINYITIIYYHLKKYSHNFGEIASFQRSIDLLFYRMERQGFLETTIPLASQAHHLMSPSQILKIFSPQLTKEEISRLLSSLPTSFPEEEEKEEAKIRIMYANSSKEEAYRVNFRKKHAKNLEFNSALSALGERLLPFLANQVLFWHKEKEHYFVAPGKKNDPQVHMQTSLRIDPNSSPPSFIYAEGKLELCPGILISADLSSHRVAVGYGHGAEGPFPFRGYSMYTEKNDCFSDFLFREYFSQEKEPKGARYRFFPLPQTKQEWKDIGIERFSKEEDPRYEMFFKELGFIKDEQDKTMEEKIISLEQSEYQEKHPDNKQKIEIKREKKAKKIQKKQEAQEEQERTQVQQKRVKEKIQDLKRTSSWKPADIRNFINLCLRDQQEREVTTNLCGSHYNFHFSSGEGITIARPHGKDSNIPPKTKKDIQSVFDNM